MTSGVRHGCARCAHESSASTQPLDGDTKLAERASIFFAVLAAVGALVRTAAFLALTGEVPPAAHAEVAVSSTATIDVAIRNR
jgi:hypothetical protein